MSNIDRLGTVLMLSGIFLMAASPAAKASTSSITGTILFALGMFVFALGGLQ